MVSVDEPFTVLQQSWHRPGEAKPIPLARRMYFPASQLEIGILPSADYEVLSPRVSGLLKYTTDATLLSNPLLGARFYACFDGQRDSPGQLFVVQDGLLHRPVKLAINGLTMVLGACGLPVDVSGVTPVVGEALREQLGPAVERLRKWHAAGAALQGFWDGQGSATWASLGQGLQRDFFS
jgi:hypothetical protein